MTQAIPASAAPESTTLNDLPAIGAAFAGGFFAGSIHSDGETFALVVSPAAGELRGRWHPTRRNVLGATSFANGMANTQAMAEAGSTLARAALALDIDGFTGWYLPARDELELLYRHFKPTARKNFAYSDGANESSVPPGEEYTSDFPGQTNIAQFAAGAPQAFAEGWYWSSTQYAANPSYAWGQSFGSGNQYLYLKSYEGRARAVRRLKIQSFINSTPDQPAGTEHVGTPATEVSA